MVVWSSIYRSMAQPGLKNLAIKSTALQALNKNGKCKNKIKKK